MEMGAVGGVVGSKRRDFGTPWTLMGAAWNLFGRLAPGVVWIGSGGGMDRGQGWYG